MKKKNAVLIVLGALMIVAGNKIMVTAPDIPNSQEFSSENIELLAHPNLSSYGPFSHVCGWDDGITYYAVLGVLRGTFVVDVTNSEIKEEDIHFFPGEPSNWRECQSYTWTDPTTAETRGYAYVVTEGRGFFKEYPGGVQIIRLDSAPRFVNTFVSGEFRSAHTITIDRVQGRAYVNGSAEALYSKDTVYVIDEHSGHRGGLVILDIETDPENPRVLGSWRGTYTHDSYALGNLLFTANIFDGLITVLDVTNPENSIVLDTLSTPLTFTHNIGISRNRRWLFATDEVPGSSLAIYEMQSPTEITLRRTYRNERIADSSIAHNVVIRGDTAYVSWYTEGVRMIDVSDPLNPREVGFFDTSSLNPLFFDPMSGNWSVWIDSRGWMYVSDIQNGLFILRPQRNK